jgi:serine protease
MANLAYSQLPKTAKAGIPYFRLSSNVTEKDYLPKTVIVKVKKEHKDLFAGKSDSRVEAVLSEIGASVPERKFPGATVPEAEKNRFGQKLVDLTRIYSFSYAAERGIEPVINSLLATGFFEYAEPHYVPRLYYNPNDPYSTSTGQYHLGRIKAYQAWDISKGDTNVVIGITDTGVEPNHPDLKDNIKRNYSDPIDGIDNDMD